MGKKRQNNCKKRNRSGTMVNGKGKSIKSRETPEKIKIKIKEGE